MPVSKIIYFNLFLTNILCIFYVPVSISMIAQSEIKLLLLLILLIRSINEVNMMSVWHYADPSVLT